MFGTFPADLDSRTGRVTLAEQIRDASERMSAAISNPTPSEREWVKQELDDIERSGNDADSDRFKRWMSSRETVKVHVKDALSGIQERADMLVSVAKHAEKDSEVEIAFWSSIVGMISNPITWQGLIGLKIMGEANLPEIETDFDKELVVCMMFARHIQNEIVVATLIAKLPENEKK